jgi:hypothetical protein
MFTSALIVILCASVTAASDTKATAKTGKSVTAVGTLMKGVECQAMKEDKTGSVFTFTKMPKGFKNGDHVKVTGTVVDISICQQGTTLAITKIVKVKK